MIMNRSQRRKKGKATKANQPIDYFHNPLLRFMKMTDEQVNGIVTVVHMSSMAVKAGHGTEEHFNNLACAVNTSMVLAEWGLCNDGDLDTLKIAMEGLVRMRKRGLSGKWGLDGDGAKFLAQALTIHDEHLQVVNRGRIMDAMNEVHKRLDSQRINK